MFHNTGFGIFISRKFCQLEPDPGHSFLGLGHNCELDLHFDVDLLGVNLEAGSKVEAGVAGVGIQLAARLTRVYAVEPRLLEEGGHRDDGAGAQHDGGV